MSTRTTPECGAVHDCDQTALSTCLVWNEKRRRSRVSGSQPLAALTVCETLRHGRAALLVGQTASVLSFQNNLEEEGACRPYSTDEHRRQTGWIGGRTGVVIPARALNAATHTRTQLDAMG